MAKVDDNEPATKGDLKALIASLDRKFEKIDKRFEKQDKRFEKQDKRFEAQDRRFEKTDALLMKMFAAISQMQEQMVTRDEFEARMDGVNRRLDDMASDYRKVYDENTVHSVRLEQHGDTLTDHETRLTYLENAAAASN